MSKVYFTKEITSNSLIKIYNALEKKLEGKIAIKISTGEPGGHNYLKPELIKDLVKSLNGTIVECCTAYGGKRMKLEDHLQTIKKHGFTDIASVDIMDSTGDFSIPVKNGRHLKENFVGKNLENYDSILMLSHFKGHAMGGFGGSLKNMSIGIASTKGKTWIHSAGKIIDPNILWDNLPPQDDFLESMAEACESVIDYMKGNIVYINVLNNLSIDCDCDSNPEAPCMSDIGVMASTDPVALDKASLDMIYQSNDLGRNHFIERVESRNGIHTVLTAEKLNLGSTKYELIDLD